MNYPSWRYHATDEPRIIHTPDDEAEGWHPSPAHHGIETAPGAESDAAIAAMRPFAGIPEDEQPFAGIPEEDQPGNLPKPRRRKAAK